MGTKQHRHGGFIGTDSKGRFVSGTRSTTRIGGWISVVSIPLAGLTLASDAVIATAVSVGSAAIAAGSLALAALVGLGAAAVAVWAIVKMWASALAVQAKVLFTGLIGWFAWEVGFFLLEIGIDQLPALSEIWNGIAP